MLEGSSLVTGAPHPFGETLAPLAAVERQTGNILTTPPPPGLSLCLQSGAYNTAAGRNADICDGISLGRFVSPGPILTLVTT